MNAGLFAAGLLGKITLVLIASATAAALTRRGAAASRHWAWTLGVGAVLSLPLAAALFPSLRAEVLPPGLIPVVSSEPASAAQTSRTELGASGALRAQGQATVGSAIASASANPSSGAVDVRRDAETAGPSALALVISPAGARALDAVGRVDLVSATRAKAGSMVVAGRSGPGGRSEAPGKLAAMFAVASSGGRGNTVTAIAPAATGRRSGVTGSSGAGAIAAGPFPTAANAAMASGSPAASSGSVVRAAAPRSGAPAWVWLWAAGSCLVAAWFSIGQFAVSRLSARARRVRDAQRLAVVEQVAAELGIRRAISVRQSRRIPLPMTYGVFRPVLLLPSDSRSWPAARLYRVLLHELAHIQRWDALTQLLAQLACALYWFHPLVWVAARRMRTLREYACDDQVLHHGARPSDYAGEILELVRIAGRADRVAAAALAMARRSQLEGRLVAILDPSQRRVSARRVKAVVSGAAVAATAMLAVVQPVARAETQRGGPLPRLSRQEAQRRVAKDPVPTAAPTERTADAAPAASSAPASSAAPTAAAASAAPAVAATPAPSAQPSRTATPAAAPAATPAPSAGGLVACLRGEGQRQSSITHNDDELRYVQSVNGRECRLEVRTEGPVAFQGDAGTISISRGGELDVRLRANGHQHRLVLRDEDGQRIREYSIDGRPAQEGEDTRELLSYVSRQVADTGVMHAHQATSRWSSDDFIPAAPPAPPAPAAPPAPFADAPPAPPVAPMPPEPSHHWWSWGHDDGDDDQQVDVDRGDDDRDDDRDNGNVIAQIQRAEKASSQGDQYRALKQIGEDADLNSSEASRQNYLAAVAKLTSDSDRAQLLKLLMREAVITPDTGRGILSVAKSLRSESDLASVLSYFHHIKESDLVRGPLVGAYLDDASQLKSDSLRSDVLRELLHPDPVPSDAVVRALGLAEAIGSDGGRKAVLREVSDHQEITSAVDAAYLKVAEGIRGTDDHQEVMDRLAEAKTEEPSRHGRNGRMVGFRLDLPGFRFNVDPGTRDDARRMAEEGRRIAQENARRMAEEGRRMAEESRRMADENRRMAQQMAHDTRRMSADAKRRLLEDTQRLRERLDRQMERLRTELDQEQRDNGDGQ